MKKKRTNVVALLAMSAVVSLMMRSMFYDWNNTEAYHEQTKRQQDVMEYQQKGGGETGDGAEEISSGIKQAESICYRYIEGCPLSKKMQREIFEICAGANLSFEIVMALIYQESGWDPECVSDEGQSVGLMQVQEKWHRETMDKLGCSDLKDPVQNVRVGTELLRGYFREYKEAAWALMAYNGGQAYADRMIEQGKTSKYAAAVLERAAEYERREG